MKPLPSSLLVLNLLVAMPALAQIAPITVTTATAPESLTELIRKGDLAAIKTVVAANPALVNGTRGQMPLSAALQSGKADIVAFLLEKGADPNAGNYNDTPLSVALTNYGQNWQTVADLLVAKGAKVNAVDNEGQTLLIRAVSYGGSSQKDKIVWLLGKGADINARNNGGRSALDTALSGSSAEVVALLLDKVDIKKTDDNGNTPLFTAVQRGNAEFVRLLLDKGADINAQNASGDTVLHLVAQTPNTMLKTLLDAGANANLKNKRGDIPLHVALRRRDDSGPRNSASFNRYNSDYNSYRTNDEGATPRGTLIAPLTDKSDINARDQFGLSPLLLATLSRDQESRDLIAERAPKMDATTQLFDAAAQGNTAVLKTLLTQKPFLVYFRLPDGTTPLHVAALWGRLSAAQMLAQKGADVNARDSKGEAPLHETLTRPTGLFARRAKNMEAFLLEKGANPAALDVNDVSPLLRAVKAGDMELITPLLAKNVDVNARDWTGQTPIFSLMTKDADLKTVNLLIERGANLNLRPAGATNSLLMLAVQTRRKELVQLLLDKGADVSVRDGENRSLLGSLISSGNEGDRSAEIAALLLAKGANPNEKIYGETLLSRAISSNSKAMVSLLLATKKVDLKAGGENRQSPLMQAVNNNRTDIVQLLLDAGADAKETDAKGRTIAQIAAEKSPEMGALFQPKTKPAA